MRSLRFVSLSLLALTSTISLAQPIPTLSLEPITIENAASLQEIFAIHEMPIRDIAWSPNSAMVAFALANGVELRPTAELNSIQFHLEAASYDNDFYSVAFNTDGSLILGGAADGYVHIWNVETGEYIRSIQGAGDVVTDITFSPDGNILALTLGIYVDVEGSVEGSLALWEGTIQLLQADDFEELDTWSNLNIILDLQFSDEGNTLTFVHRRAGYVGDTVEFWDIASHQKISQFDGLSELSNSTAFSYFVTSATVHESIVAIGCLNIVANELYIDYSSYPSSIRIWMVSPSTLITEFNTIGKAFHELTFNSDASILASLSYSNKLTIVGEGELILWDAQNGNVLFSTPIFEGHALSFSPDNRFLALLNPNTVSFYALPSN